MNKKNENTENEKVAEELEAGITYFDAKKRIYIAAIIALILLPVLWITKSIEIKHMREEADKSTLTLKRQAKKEVVHSHEDHIKLLTKPLVWAIRAEMLHNNPKQIEAFIDEIVKEENFENITVVSIDGKILTSTNKSIKGKPFSVFSDEKYLKSNKPELSNVKDKLLVMTSPIMNGKQRLGTVFIKYRLSAKF